MTHYNFDGHKLFYQVETTYKLLSGQFVTPVYAEVSPVGNCNHRCLFCAYDYVGYRPARLDTARLLRAIEEMGQLGTKAILFAGEGEPLIHPDLDRFIEQCSASGIDSAIYSNGVLLNAGKTGRILDRLAFIRISFNGGDAGTYRNVHGRDDFKTVVRNLEQAVAYKSKNNCQTTIGLQIVVVPENIRSVASLAKLGSELGVDYLAIKPFVQHPDQLGYRFEKNYSLAEVEDVIDRAESYSTDGYQVVGRKEAFRKYHERTYAHCLALPLFGVISSDGNVYSCGPYLRNPDNRYGNINDASIRDIFDGEKRKRILEFASTRLDCRTECMPNCRLDAINRSLWEIKHPTVCHVNFI